MTAGVGAGWELYRRSSLVGTISSGLEVAILSWRDPPFCSEVLCSRGGVNEGRFQVRFALCELPGFLGS